MKEKCAKNNEADVVKNDDVAKTKPSKLPLIALIMEGSSYLLLLIAYLCQSSIFVNVAFLIAILCTIVGVSFGVYDLIVNRKSKASIMSIISLVIPVVAVTLLIILYGLIVLAIARFM